MKRKSSPLILSLAWRLIKRKPQRKGQNRPMISALIGIAISLVPLVVIIELSDGMISGILNRYMETYSYHLQVHLKDNPEKQNTPLKELIKTYRKIKTIKHAYLENDGIAMGIINKRRYPLEVRGIEPQIWQEDKQFKNFFQLKQGHFQLNNNDILIGSSIADKLNLKVGDSLTLLTGGYFPNCRLLPKFQEFTVKAIFSIGYQELDRSWVFMNYQQSKRFLHKSASRDFIGIKIKNPLSSLFSIYGDIYQNTPEDTSIMVYSWKDLSNLIKQNFEMSRILLILIMAMIILISASNTSSSLFMLILENISDIAILRSLGAKPQLIMRVYFLSTIIIGLGAIILGLIIGLLISYNLNPIIWLINNIINQIMLLFSSHNKIDILSNQFYLTDITISLKPIQLFFAILFTLIVTIFSSLLPILGINKLETIKILQKQR